jgi:hypothetical protein
LTVIGRATTCTWSSEIGPTWRGPTGSNAINSTATTRITFWRWTAAALSALGLPELIDGEWSVAVKMKVDVGTLEMTRDFHGISEPVLSAGANASASFVAA